MGQSVKTRNALRNLYLNQNYEPGFVFINLSGVFSKNTLEIYVPYTDTALLETRHSGCPGLQSRGTVLPAAEVCKSRLQPPLPHVR